MYSSFPAESLQKLQAYIMSSMQLQNYTYKHAITKHFLKEHTGKRAGTWGL